MAEEARPIKQWYTSPPIRHNSSAAQYLEPPSEKIAWMELSRLADIPEEGRELFSGTLAEKNRLFREFRSFVRQARTYWDAARLTRGSAAALPYYYCFLQLAKAELLQTHPSEVLGARVGHGLSFKTNSTRRFGSDALTVHDGAFRLLTEKRLGSALPNRTRLPIPNLLRLIPEIGLEVSTITSARPLSAWGYHSVVGAGHEAASVIGIVNLARDDTEFVMRALRRSYREIDINSISIGWRRLFALSSRATLGLTTYESKQTFTMVDQSGAQVPDWGAAAIVPTSALGHYLSSPISAPAEFVLTHSVFKSKELIVPLPLARYAALFYLSSLVRYKPSAIDAQTEPRQAWIMDSFVDEVPLELLINSWEAISGRSLFFEELGFRV